MVFLDAPRYWFDIVAMSFRVGISIPVFLENNAQIGNPVNVGLVYRTSPCLVQVAGHCCIDIVTTQYWSGSLWCIPKRLDSVCICLPVGNALIAQPGVCDIDHQSQRGRSPQRDSRNYLSGASHYVDYTAL